MPLSKILKLILVNILFDDLARRPRLEATIVFNKHKMDTGKR